MKKIFVVDDNADVRFSIIEGLKDIGANFSFIEAEDGAKCIDMLKKGAKPDLILLDIMMPKMDGWDVAANVKSNPDFKDIPIVFLTAKTDDLSKGMGTITGDEYICKPFDIYDLKQRIEKALNKQ